MKKLVIINVILILGLLLVPAVSAYEETFSEEVIKSGWVIYGKEGGGTITGDTPYTNLYSNRIQDFNGLQNVILIVETSSGFPVSVPTSGVGKSTPVTAKIESDVLGEGIIGYNVNYNSDGSWKNTIYYITFDYFSPLSYSGGKSVSLIWDQNIVPAPVLKKNAKTGAITSSSPDYTSSYIEYRAKSLTTTYTSSQYNTHFSWVNTLSVNDHPQGINIKLVRNGGSSYLGVTDINLNKLVYTETDTSDTEVVVYSNDINITLRSPTTTYYRDYYRSGAVLPPGEQNYPVRVDVESAATGAKISNAQLGVRKYRETTWRHNETLTYGWTQFYLPAGDYEFFVTATGYTQPSPGRLTVDGVDDNIVLLLYPVTPPPEAGNVTLQVWANYGTTGSGQRYSVPRAEINIVGLAGEGADFDSGILTANDQGLVIIDVPGNSTYSVYASKTGYTSGETEFSVTTASPVHVSVELTPTGGLPTYPVTVYAQSSATGALVNNANLGIRLYGNENWLHNETLTYGWTQVLLPEGNYEFFVDATGYTQPSPGRLTVDGVDDNIVLLLYPMIPPPSAGNVTLQVWANYGVTGSGQRYAVPGAEINIVGLAGEGAGFDSGILTANDQGMVILEVPGNTSYNAYASKSGYTSGETEFIVTTVSPVHVSVALEKLALPTEPPVTPSVPPTTPTPAETPGEGFISQVANAFAVFLGVPYTTGKTALGMVIASAVGFTTAKQLRGGAPEFGVGLLAGAGLATLIGLLPVWLFVVLILVVGMLIGYKYMQGGQ